MNLKNILHESNLSVQIKKEQVYKLEEELARFQTGDSESVAIKENLSKAIEEHAHALFELSKLHIYLERAKGENEYFDWISTYRKHYQGYTLHIYQYRTPTMLFTIEIREEDIKKKGSCKINVTGYKAFLGTFELLNMKERESNKLGLSNIWMDCLTSTFTLSEEEINLNTIEDALLHIKEIKKRIIVKFKEEISYDSTMHHQALEIITDKK